jgi:excisionase family DNA binding protein
MSLDGITTAEAAELTGYSERHIRRLASDGTVDARLVGKQLYLVDKASLLAYVEKMDRLGKSKHAHKR